MLLEESGTINLTNKVRVTSTFLDLASSVSLIQSIEIAN